MQKSKTHEEAFALPEELKLETYERILQTAVFDVLDLVIKFMPGKDGIGAVIEGFKYSIAGHDNIVKQIEEQMLLIESLKHIYNRAGRLFRNLDSAWNCMLDTHNPADFYEYQELIPKMKNIEERIQVIEDPQIKANLVAQYNRYHKLHPVCSNQLIIYNTFVAARHEKDEAFKNLMDAEKELVRRKETEKEVAASISDDHILADEMKKSLQALFPNLHEGMILKRINGEDVEHIPFDLCMAKVGRAKSPHKTEFLRYDYRFDRFQRRWHSLQELREMGVCVEDPMLQRANFVALASKGDAAMVSSLLLQGQDPNSRDYSGATAILMAAANKHQNTIELLAQAGADINCRDKNLMTPLLFCVSRGYVSVARQLIALGADKFALDKNNRSTTYYSVLSGSIDCVKLFLREDKRNDQDKLWGYAPLHLAANQGNVPVIEHLVGFGCNIYLKDKKGNSPEIVARLGKHLPAVAYLEKERFDAPGQLVYVHDRRKTEFWIGDEKSMHPKFIDDAGITTVIYISAIDDTMLPEHASWLADQQEPGLLIKEHPEEENRPTSAAKSPKSKKNSTPDVSFLHLTLRLDIEDDEITAATENVSKMNNGTGTLPRISNDSGGTGGGNYFGNNKSIDSGGGSSGGAKQRARLMSGDTLESNASNDDGDEFDDDISHVSDISYQSYSKIPQQQQQQQQKQITNGTSNNKLTRRGTDNTSSSIVPIGNMNNSRRSSQKGMRKLSTVVVAGGGTDLMDELEITDPSYDITWNAVYEIIPQIIAPVKYLLENDAEKILICDRTGNCLAPIVVTIMMLIRCQIRDKESLKMCKEARPRVTPPRHMVRGLEKLQKHLDDKSLLKLNARLRKASSLSVAF